MLQKDNNQVTKIQEELPIANTKEHENSSKKEESSKQKLIEEMLQNNYLLQKLQIYDSQIDQIMKEAKLEEKSLKKVKCIIFQQRSVDQIGTEVKGELKAKLLQRLHLIKQKVSKQRIYQNKTTKERQLRYLFTEYSLDLQMMNLSKAALKQEIQKILIEKADQFLKRTLEIQQYFSMKEQQFIWKKNLKDILKSAGIEQTEKVQKCIFLFQQKKIKQLLQFPQKQYREVFSKSLKQLQSKMTNKIDQQKSVKKKNYEKYLVQLLKQVQIYDKKQIQECIQLFRIRKIEQILEYTSGNFRQTFAQKLQKIIEQLNQQEQKQQPNDIVNKLIVIFNENGIKQQQHQKLLNLFLSHQPQNLKQLKKYPRKSFKQNFAIKIDQLAKLYKEKSENKQPRRFIQLNDTSSQNKNTGIIKIISKKKQQESVSKQDRLSKLLQKFEISHEKQKQYLNNLEIGELQFLVAFTHQQRKLILKAIENQYSFSNNCNMKTQIIVSLTNHLSEDKIIKVCRSITDGKYQRKQFGFKLEENHNQIIDQIIEKFSSTIVLSYMDNQASVKINQMQKNKAKFLKNQIIQLIGENIQYKIYYEDDSIQIEKIENKGFQPGKQYKFFLYEAKKFNTNYNNKTKKITLIPTKSLKYNKEMILEELQKKDLVIDDEQQFTSQNRLQLIFQNKEGEKKKFNQNNITLYQVEQQFGTIQSIIIQVTLNIQIYYEDIRGIQTLSSADKFIQLRKIVNQKYIPYASQIIYLEQGKQNNISLQQSRDLDNLATISSKSLISFTLANRCSLQFYGFHQNIALSFENFSDFFIEDKQSTKNMICNCTFTNKRDQQFRFMQYFFYYLFSAIKRRFSIQTIIEKFKNLVAKIKSEIIWNPSEGQYKKVNEAFVYAYALRNADTRLRIQLMNLLKQNVPIPLYFRDFEKISKVSCSFKLNQQLLWVLKQGFTIASIGLHKKQKNSNEVGKSSFLNKIFRTNFSHFQEKHQIIKGIPYIAVRVFQNIAPLHIIDIPRDCSQQIKYQILRNSNLIFIHSWLSQTQTEDWLNTNKNLLNIPTICLIRDWKEKINLHNLKGNISLQKPQKVNIFTQNTNIEINTLRDQIFDFIKPKIKSNQTKIFGIYQKNELFGDFSQLLDPLKKKILNLGKIGQEVEFTKRKQKQYLYYEEQLKQRKEMIKIKLSPQLKSVLQYLIKQQAKPHQNLLLGLLRQKLKTFQNQLNIYYAKIYEKRDNFQKIKEITNEQQKMIKITELNQQLKVLYELKPEAITKKSDKEITQIIQKMITLYENKIKPKIFSIELFWRQFNYLLTIDQSFTIADQLLVNIVKELKEVQIKSNLPFQIIDGDLLQMPRKLLKSLFQNQDQQFITISILGPQSSGKSTLLNFMFGCDFSTSEGRCTRGVYGTYFRFAQNKGHFNKISNCSGIFVIDTQGIFGITNDKDREQLNRENFQSKLILFCLAVSDFVVINVRGNFDANTQKMLRVCHQKLQQLNKDIKSWPEIIVVLNQNPSNKKDQHEIDFKEIKKTFGFSFNISKSLSLAYKVKTYDRKLISLLGKNQKLTKKQPEQDFLNQTTELMNIILEKIRKKNVKQILKLSQIITKFQTIWAMLTSFPNLSKPVTKQYQELQNEIKKFKDQQEKQQQKKIQQMLNQLKDKKIQVKKIYDYIQFHEQKTLQAYDAKFRDHFNNDNQIKQLKQRQRENIKSKTSRYESFIRDQVKSNEAKERLRIQRIQGNYNLKQLAIQISKMQINNNINKQKKKMFDEYFEKQLKRIKQSNNLKEQSRSSYDKIYEDYLYLVKEQTKSQRGLPREKIQEQDENLELNKTIQMFKQKLIDPTIKTYEDVLFHTQKLNTNILDLKGGNSDVSKQYFDMNNYFKSEQIVLYYDICPSNLKSCLKIQMIKQKTKQKFEKAHKTINKQYYLKKCWQEINNSLQKIGIQFTDFKQFVQLYKVQQEKNIFSYFKDIICRTPKRQHITFRFLKNDQNQSYKSKSLDSHKKKISTKQQKTNKEKKKEIVLSNFIIREIDGRYIQEYKQTQEKKYLSLNFYKHINWRQISQMIKKNQDYSLIQIEIEKKITQEFNQDIKCLNLQLVYPINYKNIFDKSEQLVIKDIQFKVIEEKNEISQKYTYYDNAIICQFIDGKKMKSFIYEKSSKYKNYLCLFEFKTMKLEPNINNTYFKNYLDKNKNLTIHQLKMPEVKKFIFNQLKNNRKSFDKFYWNVFKIVQNVMKSWQKLEKNTLARIYNKVSQEICKFNNDLNQISCNLHQKYIGYINLVVVNMIWKLQIDKKVKEKQKIIEDKKKQYDNEWKLLLIWTSNDDQKKLQTQIDQFIDRFKQFLKESTSGQKKKMFFNNKQTFKKDYSRQIIQSLIDTRIFCKQRNQQKILAYLENPYEVINQKYEECYESIWKKMKDKYSFESTIGYTTMNELYLLLTELNIFFEEEYKFSENCKMFSDFFKIKEGQNKSKNNQASTLYEQKGKRVYFECLIDILLNDDPNKNRKCMEIQVQLIKKFPTLKNHNAKLKEILLKLKSSTLEIQNLVKFVKIILKPQIKQKFQKKIREICDLNDKDKKNFIDIIKVSVCDQKCPGCGRICGIQNQHQFHKCLYGHQMRGINGNYIQRQNNVKEASVIRCQNMAQTDMIKYNGNFITWKEFKQYWKNKKDGGWLYDDANLKNNSNQLRFQQAWKIAGPIYCEKHKIKFVSFNKANSQLKQQQLEPIHYIFALDQSYSMQGKNWQDLMTSFKETVLRIKVKDNNRNILKISIIKFNNSIQAVCENQNPSRVNPNLAFNGGATDFNPVFNEAARIVQKYIKKSIIIFIFMTDGYSSIPTQGIKTIKMLQINHPHKLHYSGILLNNFNNSTMDIIAKQLNGKNGVAMNLEQLKTLYHQSIEIIRFNQGK